MAAILITGASKGIELAAALAFGRDVSSCCCHA